MAARASAFGGEHTRERRSRKLTAWMRVSHLVAAVTLGGCGPAAVGGGCPTAEVFAEAPARTPAAGLRAAARGTALSQSSGNILRPWRPKTEGARRPPPPRRLEESVASPLIVGGSRRESFDDAEVNDTVLRHLVIHFLQALPPAVRPFRVYFRENKLPLHYQSSSPNNFERPVVAGADPTVQTGCVFAGGKKARGNAVPGATNSAAQKVPESVAVVEHARPDPTPGPISADAVLLYADFFCTLNLSYGRELVCQLARGRLGPQVSPGALPPELLREHPNVTAAARHLLERAWPLALAKFDDCVHRMLAASLRDPSAARLCRTEAQEYWRREEKRREQPLLCGLPPEAAARPLPPPSDADRVRVAHDFAAARAEVEAAAEPAASPPHGQLHVPEEETNVPQDAEDSLPKMCSLRRGKSPLLSDQLPGPPESSTRGVGEGPVHFAPTADLLREPADLMRESADLAREPARRLRVDDLRPDEAYSQFAWATLLVGYTNWLQGWQMSLTVSGGGLQVTAADLRTKTMLTSGVVQAATNELCSLFFHGWAAIARDGLRAGRASRATPFCFWRAAAEPHLRTKGLLPSLAGRCLRALRTAWVMLCVKLRETVRGANVPPAARTATRLQVPTLFSGSFARAVGWKIALTRFMCGLYFKLAAGRSLAAAAGNRAAAAKTRAAAGAKSRAHGARPTASGEGRIASGGRRITSGGRLIASGVRPRHRPPDAFSEKDFRCTPGPPRPPNRRVAADSLPPGAAASAFGGEFPAGEDRLALLDAIATADLLPLPAGAVDLASPDAALPEFDATFDAYLLPATAERAEAATA